jgi:hypothetical protein
MRPALPIYLNFSRSSQKQNAVITCLPETQFNLKIYKRVKYRPAEKAAV